MTHGRFLINISWRRRERKEREGGRKRESEERKMEGGRKAGREGQEAWPVLQRKASEKIRNSLEDQTK